MHLCQNIIKGAPDCWLYKIGCLL